MQYQYVPNRVAFCAFSLYNKDMFNTVKYNQIGFMHQRTESVNRGNFTNHCHTSYEILFVMNGSGTFLIENTAYEFSKDAVFLIPPGRYHVLQVPPQRDYERCVINFAPELLPAAVHAPDNLQLKADDSVRELFLKFDRYADTYQDESLYALLLSFLTELLVILTHSQNEIESVRRSDIPPLVKKAVDYICRNLDKPLSVEQIAEQLFVSQSYLNHIFAKTMNIGIMGYARLKKMYEAREYLQRGYPVLRVAELLGYKSYPTFLRNYRAEFGKSPTDDVKSDTKDVLLPDNIDD